MVNAAEQTARNAEAVQTNDVGFCLVWCRTRAGIDALYPTAAEAGLHADNLHRNRDIPRGAFAFWTGGSEGAGHIAIAIGDSLVRSTDADGPGRVATRDLAWFDTNWPALTYLGWADNVNGITVPGVGDDMPLNDADKAWILQAIKDNAPAAAPTARDIVQAILSAQVDDNPQFNVRTALRRAGQPTK